MWARKGVIRHFIQGTSSLNQLGLEVKIESRKLHTIRTQAKYSLADRSGGRQYRVAGYFLISRNESTVTTIPPVTSEVFSKRVSSGTPSPTSASLTTESEGVVRASTSVTQQNGVSVNEEVSSAFAASIQESSASETIRETVGSATPSSESSQSLIWESIPEPPKVPGAVDETGSLVLNAAGEPTLHSLGLGGWSPSGIVQQVLEAFHANVGLPWWGAIMLGTVCVRLLVFPLVIKSQRNSAKMANNLPQMQAIQLKMTEARQTGNSLMAAKYAQDLMLFMKEKDISPFKNLMVPLAMAPIFISFFFGLRKMANLPVESMKDGGLFWFTDLTVADPYFLLPLMTSVTMWITLEVGVDGVQINASQHGQLMKYFIRALPVIVFPLTMNFPAAILCYWVSTNAVSLVQVSMLKIPAIREALNIQQLRKWDPDALPMKKKPFVQSVKDSWTNVKITKEMEDRQRYDEVTFKRAGRGPIPKTYKYDPTKVGTSTPANAVQAKHKQ